MTQPDHVPISAAERVRAVRRLPPPAAWWPTRPGDLAKPFQPVGRDFGVPGPDQGYALLLARRFEHRLVLQPHEHGQDAVAGCVATALRRSALFGHAPSARDLEHAFTLWGFLSQPPQGLGEMREPLFKGAAEDYWRRRRIASAVPEQTLRMQAHQLREHLERWPELFATP